MGLLTALTTRRRLLAGAAGAAASRALLRVAPARALAAPRAPRGVTFELGVGALRRDRAGRRVSRVLAAGGRFDLAGARWRGGPADGDVELRARRRGGPWSEWTPAPGLQDHAPDHAGAAHGTDGVWFGGADLVQVRASAPLPGLRLHLVNSTGTATRAARRASRAWRAQAALARPRAQTAASGTPHIIPRSVWDPNDQCHPRVPASYGTVSLAFVHHTVNANDYSASESAGIVLAIGLYHRNSNGWNDIGYNFLVDRYGQIFEGRAGGVRKAVIGAQAQGFNSCSTGMANLGTFDAVGQTKAGIAALAKLIAWKLNLHRVPLTGSVTVTSLGGSSNRFASGEKVSLHRVSGHRDGCLTDCPGTDLYGQIPRLRALVAGSKPAQSATSVTLDGPLGAVTAGRAAALSGRLLLGGRPAPPGTVVQIQSIASATPLATVMTADDGTFTAAPTLPATSTLEAVFVDPTHDLISDPLLVNVAPALKLRCAKPRVRTGQSAALTLASTPAVRPLTLVVQRRDRRGWRTVLRRRLPRGAKRARVVLHRATRYRARLEWHGSATYASAHTGWVDLRATGAATTGVSGGGGGAGG